MRLVNATLKLYNSEFANNGVLLSHSQIADDNCSNIALLVYNCVFNNDLDSRPVYQVSRFMPISHTALVPIRQKCFVASPWHRRCARCSPCPN